MYCDVHTYTVLQANLRRKAQYMQDFLAYSGIPFQKYPTRQNTVHIRTQLGLMHRQALFAVCIYMYFIYVCGCD